MSPRGETFESDGVRIEYDDLRPDVGAGEPIVLIHGFASSRRNNWAEQGWYDTFEERGRRVIALDNRGHGESEKLYDPAIYGIPTMAEDVVNLLDHLDVDTADVFGYSMGGRITVEFVQRVPERINAAVMGGIGSRIQSDSDARREGIARALEADDVEEIEHQRARDFRLFAEGNDADLEALAAVMRAHGSDSADRDLSRVEVPILVAAGEKDELVGDPVELAEAFGNGEGVVIPDTDHLTTVPDDRFVAAITDFLDRKGL